MRSLYRRMTVTHTLVALLAVLLVGVLASGLIVRAYRDVSAAQAQRQARGVAERLSRPLAQLFISNRGWDGAADLIGRRLAEGDIDERLILFDPRGRVLYDSAGELDGRPLPPRLRPLGVPIDVRGRPVGFVAVVPGADDLTAADGTFVRALAGIVVAGSLAAVGVALIVAAFVARRLVRPLAELTAGARRLAAGEAHEPIATPQDAELAELARAFNMMAAELDRQEQLRRQMVADIAHELRTPLTVLRLQVESMEDGLVAASPQAVGALGGEIDLLARLVDDLRLLSLADASQLSLALQPVSPHEAIEAAARGAEARARQRGLALHVEVLGPLPAVRADPQRLAQILGNLVENALRYTPAGGQVVLGAALEQEPRAESREPKGIVRSGARQPAGDGPGVSGNAVQGKGARERFVRFSVRDTGPGIPPDDLPRVFERFYRADRARARETGGSGLGLAIVQRLAAAQGGAVAVESAPGRGSTFSVSLPVA